MALQYLRNYKLTINNGDTLREVKGLRIAFEVTKSMLSYPNLGRIKIFNPNKETLSSVQKKFTEVSLSIGYGDQTKLLFKGDVRNVFQEKRDADRIITIYAGDGDRSWQNSNVNKTFGENVSLKTVLDEITKTFLGILPPDLSSVPDVADKLRGQVISGSSKDALNQLGEDYGFQWSIQDGELVVVFNDSILRPNEAVLITSRTGMIGSPTITEIGADVETLLNPELLPNRSFQVESKGARVTLGNLYFRDVPNAGADGVYKIQEVTHRGDTHTDVWSSTVKGRSVRDG